MAMRKPITDQGQKDAERSLALGEAIDAEVAQCWQNARKAILSVPEYATATYIEGMGVIANYEQPVRRQLSLCIALTHDLRY